MPDVVLTKNRIAPGKTERLREWMAEIRSRENEALETLEHEGMHEEAAFLERTDDGDYLVYYMKADDVDEVFASFENSPYDIDQEHREVMDEVLASGADDRSIELLYHLSNPERP